MSTRLEVRSVHESTTFTNQLHHYGAFLDFPTRKHAIALTLILVYFRSIQFKLSNNRAQLSKQSLTADADIRIVLLPLQGCTATHTCHQLPPLSVTVQEVTARMPPKHFAHSSDLVQRVAYLRGICMEVRPRFQYGLKRCVQGPKPVLKIRSSTSQTVPHPYQNSELLRLLGFERGEVLGREGPVSPMCGCTLLLGSPHKNSDRSEERRV